jgi:hypothetical protein
MLSPSQPCARYAPRKHTPARKKACSAAFGDNGRQAVAVTADRCSAQYPQLHSGNVDPARARLSRLDATWPTSHSVISASDCSHARAAVRGGRRHGNDQDECHSDPGVLRCLEYGQRGRANDLASCDFHRPIPGVLGPRPGRRRRPPPSSVRCSASNSGAGAVTGRSPVGTGTALCHDG